MSKHPLPPIQKTNRIYQQSRHISDILKTNVELIDAQVRKCDAENATVVALETFISCTYLSSECLKQVVGLLWRGGDSSACMSMMCIVCDTHSLWPHKSSWN